MGATRETVAAIASLMLLLAGWFTASSVTRGFIPTPWETLSVFTDPVFVSNLLEALALTAERALAGFIAGLLAGILLGMVASILRVNLVLEPLAAVVASVPSVAWIPLLIALVGVDEFKLPVLAAFMCALPPILYEVLNAVSTLDPEVVGVARLLGARGARLWRAVILPEVLTRIFPAVKVEALMVWKTVFAAEMIVVPSGLGYLAMLYADMLDLKHLIAVILVLALCLSAIVSCMSILERRVLAARGFANV